MKFIGLNGKEYKLDTRRSSYPMRTEASSPSKIQYACSQILREKFPVSTILEEVTLPGHKLRLDFFIPDLKLVIEVNGEQHKEYNTFFYKTRRAFLDAQARDSDKASLCEMNNWTLMTVETIDDLKELLNG